MELIKYRVRFILEIGVMEMNLHDHIPRAMPNLRLCPEKRICPMFDDVSIARFPVAAPGEMGVRVLDNCCEEHIM